MPNYGLVVTPQYNPMSYEQYVQPFKDYAQVYNDTADKIDALEMEANKWEKLAESEKDAPQYNQYQNYANDLRSYADELATKGLSGRTRAGLSKMRQRYAKEILPIEDAFNRREADIKAEDELLARDPSIVFDASAREKGLGEYMAGTPQRYAVSGEDVYQKAKAAFEAISKRKISFDTAQRLFNNTYYAIIEEIGEANPAAVLQRVENMSPEELEGVGITPENYGDFYEYALAIQDTLERTNYNKLTDYGKSKILSSAVLGGNTGLVYDKNYSAYHNPYAVPRTSGTETPSNIPAVTTTVVRGQTGKPSNAADNRKNLDSKLEKVRSPWTANRSTGDRFSGRFDPKSPVQKEFESPNEAITWTDSVIGAIEDFYADINKRQSRGELGADEKYSLTLNIDGTEVPFSQVSSVLADAKEIKSRIEEYHNDVMPFFRTLQIDDNAFATPQQLALIAQIKHNTAARQSITQQLESTDEKDRKAKKDKYNQITSGVKNTERESKNSRGIYKIDEKTGKTKKVTKPSTYDEVVENGNLVYSSEYGLVIQSGEDLYQIKGDVDVDSFNKSNAAIIQALNFDDSLYGLDTNTIKNTPKNGQMDSLIITRDGNNYLNPNAAVYKDRNITIYEGIDGYGDVVREVVDNTTGNHITKISMLEASDQDGFLSSGDFQQGINHWWKHALKLTTVPNDTI